MCLFLPHQILAFGIFFSFSAFLLKRKKAKKDENAITDDARRTYFFVGLLCVFCLSSASVDVDSP